MCHFYFLNNFVKHWPNLITLVMQHQELDVSEYKFADPHLNTVATLPCET